MQILIVSPLLPALASSDPGGTHRRVRTFLRALQPLGSQIEFTYLVPPDRLAVAANADAFSRSQSDFWGVPLHASVIARRERHETLWNHYGAGLLRSSEQPVFRGFGGAELAQRLAAKLDRGPDIVFVHRLEAMLPVLRSGRKPRHLFLDLDDVEHKLRLRSALSGPVSAAKLAELAQLPAVFATERRAVAFSALTFVCSRVDQTHLRRLGFGSRVRVVPNAVDVPPEPPGVVGAKTVMFLGACNYPPNRIAALRLITDIWPLIRACVPEARLLIAGRATEELADPATAGVECLGFVPDLGELYARTRIACCPISTGSGTRVKLIEAAAFARPMVSTRIGAEGLDFTDGHDILLHDDDVGLADACVRLMRDDALCARLGAAGRATMRRRYEAREVQQAITSMMQASLG